MREYTSLSVARQVENLRAQFAQSNELPFNGVLPRDRVEKALVDLAVEFRDRIYTPVTTLLVYLWQVLSVDHSCRAAVAKLAAHRAAQGQKPCSTKTGAYCKARNRLPEELPARLTRETGEALHRNAPRGRWLQGRPVKVFDGSTASMPDTPANQQAYPQHPRQEKGAGFPLARIGVLFSLAVGTVLEMGLCRYKGKGQSEQALFRGMLPSLEPGDIVLTDRYLCTFFLIAMVLGRRADMVCRLHQSRSADFRRGRRLGRGDHLVFWRKPRRPWWMRRSVYAALPEVLWLREVRVRVPQPGFRTKTLIVVTTLLDPNLYPAEEIALAYRARWQAELNLRSLKQVMQMEMLRTETPRRVRTEIWMHLLAYNLIRTVMAQAAQRRGCMPCEISFKGSLQILTSFQPLFSCTPRTKWPQLFDILLTAIAQHVVGDRPNRYEPRAVKRRPKHYPRLKTPRHVAKLKLAKGVAA
jgi:hypothetical protein